MLTVRVSVKRQAKLLDPDLEYYAVIQQPTANSGVRKEGGAD
jgi:hypothetical protein